MKIRNKPRNVNINKILIQQDSSGGTNVTIIVNNQMIEMFMPCVYISDILEKINDYCKVLGV